jgi:hypothetical protein
LNVWRDFLITYSGAYDSGTFSKPVASNNIGIYGNSGGAAPDAVTFARDNIYNHFENYRIEKCGWNIKLLNDPASPSGGGAVLAQNVFRKGVHHARNGLWLAGVKGDRFLDIVQESSDAASVALRIKASGVNTCQYNLLDFQHWEYANGTTFDIDASCTYNDFRCQLDPFANFPSLATLGKYQQYRTNTEHQQVTSAGDRIVLNTSGQFVVSRSDSSYTPVSGYQFQNEKNTLFGSSGGNNNHRAHVGTNEQYVIAQDGGVGGMSLMGGGATSSANLVFGNSFTTTPTERWRQWLDGSDNSLNFGQGFTWKSAAGTPASSSASIGASRGYERNGNPRWRHDRGGVEGLQHSELRHLLRQWSANAIGRQGIAVPALGRLQHQYAGVHQYRRRHDVDGHHDRRITLTHQPALQRASSLPQPPSDASRRLTAALASLIWSLLRIYETQTVQGWFKRWRDED